MISSDESPRENRRESGLAFSVIFFAFGLLCFLLGWAEGVRRGTAYLHIPQTGSCLVLAAIFVVIGAMFLIWSRRTKRH